MPQRALVHPLVDFWLLGGLSILVLGVIWLLQGQTDLKLNFKIPLWAYSLSFAVNYPHFAYSYQLFYDGYWQRLTGTETTMTSRLRLAIAGLAVPLIMIAVFYYAYVAKDVKILSYGVNAMMFFVGWHYVKQGYGVLITTSVYKSVFYAEWQKRILWGNAYILWIYSWLRANKVLARHSFHDLDYYTFDVPDALLDIGAAVAFGSTAATLFVFAWVYFKEKKPLSFTGIFGYACAIYLWLVAPLAVPAFFYLVPFFHSLQYLPFVYKVKKSALLTSGQVTIGKITRVGLFAFMGVALGGLFMNLFPKELDSALRDQYIEMSLTPNFMLVCFLLFINIHHFFIDSAYWRRDNKDVQQHLFKA
jgi:hypothetical protein